MLNEKILNRNERIIKEVKRAIDYYTMSEYQKIEHGPNLELAKAIVDKIQHRLMIPSSNQAVLLDYDSDVDGFKNPRVVENDWGCIEEALYPTDPETDEPIEERIADFVWPLPDIDCVPEI